MVLKDDMYVKCNSEDEAKEFIKMAYEQGWKWSNNNNTCETTCWERIYNGYIIYHLWDDKIISYIGSMRLTPKSVIEYSDLKNETSEQTKEINRIKIKNGMIVKCYSKREADELINEAYKQGYKWNKVYQNTNIKDNFFSVNCNTYYTFQDMYIDVVVMSDGDDVAYNYIRSNMKGNYDYKVIDYIDLKNKPLKKIFIINGSGGVGKDTFVKTVGKFIDVKNYSSVQPMKDAAKLLGWNGGKTEKDRKFLSDLKVLASKYNGCTYYNNILKQIQEFLYDKDNVVLFIHMREPKDINNIISIYNEVINFKGDYNPIETILVIRDSVKDIESNIADAGVNDYEYDFIIDNSGTLLELENIVIDLIEKYNLLNKTAIAYAKVSY